MVITFPKNVDFHKSYRQMFVGQCPNYNRQENSFKLTWYILMFIAQFAKVQTVIQYIGSVLYISDVKSFKKEPFHINFWKVLDLKLTWLFKT